MSPRPQNAQASLIALPSPFDITLTLTTLTCGSVIEMYPPVRRDFPIEDWSEEKKEAVLEKAVEVLSRVHNLDIAVTVKRVVSPKDFRNNLNLYRGAVYGLSPQVERLTRQA